MKMDHLTSDDRCNIEIVLKSIRSYLSDPPDTDFQKGYLAAMLEVAKYLATNDGVILRNHPDVLKAAALLPVAA